MKDLFIDGGPFMWPLLICSVIALGVIIERLIAFIRSRTNADEFMIQIVDALEDHPDFDKKEDRIQSAIEMCEANGSPVSHIIRAGLEKAGKTTRSIERAMEKTSIYQISLLEKGLAILATLATISPLIGFLGTVSGMIKSFSVIAESATRDPQGVARGISEALITTATGLLISIPIFVAYNFFTNWVGQFVMQIEESAGTLVDSLIEIEEVTDVHVDAVPDIHLGSDR